MRIQLGVLRRLIREVLIEDSGGVTLGATVSISATPGETEEVSDLGIEDQKQRDLKGFYPYDIKRGTEIYSKKSVPALNPDGFHLGP